MKAAIFDPYLDTLGGGERYVLTFARVLKTHGWDVDVQWHDPSILQKIDERLNIGLDGIKVVENVHTGTGYDLIFWLSDGSIPALWSKKNILHFQTPFLRVGGGSLLNRLKLKKISKVVCNSRFTKENIDKEFGTSSEILYPPVDVPKIKPLEKENIILYVGRFSKLQQEKRQDVLIDAFKQLCDGGLEGWKLVMIGGSNIGGEEFMRMLREKARGYLIEILENQPFAKVTELYGKAKIFWSAAGFGVDENIQPQKVEHFGISTVEAMAAGCVPIVVNKGGYKEVVENGVDGFLWNDVGELKSITLHLIKEERRREEIAKNAERKSKEFSQERFEQEVLQYVV